MQETPNSTSTKKLEELCSSAKTKFKLERKSCTHTERRILNDEDNVKGMASSSERRRKKALTLKNTRIERNLREWVYERWNNHVNITDALIQGKKMYIFCSSGEERIIGGKYGTKFSTG